MKGTPSSTPLSTFSQHLDRYSAGDGFHASRIVQYDHIPPSVKMLQKKKLAGQETVAAGCVLGVLVNTATLKGQNDGSYSDVV